MSETSLGKQTHYAIHIKEYIAPCWTEWFEGLTIKHLTKGGTILSGPVVDQAALHGWLAKIRDLNLTLISVAQVEPSKNKDRQ